MIITALVGDHRCESAVLITFLAEVDQNCTFSMATFEKCGSDHFLGRSWSELHFFKELVRTALFSLVKVIRTALVSKSGQNRSYAIYNIIFSIPVSCLISRSFLSRFVNYERDREAATLVLGQGKTTLRVG